MKRILISRTDKIGDVVLTLPLAGAIKSIFPSSEIVFLGRNYTREVIESCGHVDRFLDWGVLEALPFQEQVDRICEENIDSIIHVFPQVAIARLAFAARIPLRIGTIRRWYHWLNCNRFVALSRNRSGLHEAQLNLKLLSGLGVNRTWTLSEISDLYGLNTKHPMKVQLPTGPNAKAFRLTIHPRSRGSAREWPIEFYAQLIKLLDVDKYDVFITGTLAEADDVDKLLQLCGSGANVHNLCGKIGLDELMSLLESSDGVLGASTGPVHIAAALGTRTMGLYPPISPMDGSRWGPVGRKAEFLSSRMPGACQECRKIGPCRCMFEINPEDVLARINAWQVEKQLSS